MILLCVAQEAMKHVKIVKKTVKSTHSCLNIQYHYLPAGKLAASVQCSYSTQFINKL